MTKEYIDLIDLLKNHGLSGDTSDMLKDILKKKPQPFTERWYRLHLKERFMLWEDDSEDADWKEARMEKLNVDLWKKAMEAGYTLYRGRLKGSSDTHGGVEAYFLVPNEFNIVLIFFGDDKGFYPQYLLTTPEKFKEYAKGLEAVLKVKRKSE